MKQRRIDITSEDLGNIKAIVCEVVTSNTALSDLVTWL